MWVRNYKVPGEKCALAMDTGSGSSDESTKKKSKQPSRYKPPSDTPRVLKEPVKTKERLALYKAFIEEAAQKYQLAVPFIQAVMRVESNFKYRAVSQAGAQGLMQLMPKTGLSMGVTDPFDPRQNIMGASRLLRVLFNRFDGDIVKILSAYHAGSGAVATKGDRIGSYLLLTLRGPCIQKLPVPFISG